MLLWSSLKSSQKIYPFLLLSFCGSTDSSLSYFILFIYFFCACMYTGNLFSSVINNHSRSFFPCKGSFCLTGMNRWGHLHLVFVLFCCCLGSFVFTYTDILPTFFCDTHKAIGESGLWLLWNNFCLPREETKKMGLTAHLLCNIWLSLNSFASPVL